MKIENLAVANELADKIEKLKARISEIDNALSDDVVFGKIHITGTLNKAQGIGRMHSNWDGLDIHATQDNNLLIVNFLRGLRDVYEREASLLQTEFEAL